MSTHHPLLEKLTAVLMNEADSATQAEIKLALENDPSLAAEEQRLRATIALVQTELGDGQALAPHRVEDLLSSAAKLSGARSEVLTSPHSWGALMRSAAAVVLLSGGVWGVLQYADQGHVEISDEQAYDERIASIARANLLGQLAFRQANPRVASGNPDDQWVGRYRSLANQERQSQQAYDRPLTRDSGVAGEVFEYGELGAAVDFEIEGGAVRESLGMSTTTLSSQLPGEKYGGRSESRKNLSKPGAPGKVSGAPSTPSALATSTPSAPAVGGESWSNFGALGYGGGGGGGGAYRGPGDSIPPSREAAQAVPSLRQLPDLKRSKSLGTTKGKKDSFPARKDSRLQALGYSTGSPSSIGPANSPEEMEREEIRQDSEMKTGSHEFFLGRDVVDDQLESQESVNLAMGDEPTRPARVPIHIKPIQDTVDQRYQDARHNCLVGPNDHLPNLYQQWWGDNPWELTMADSQATFGADVDTASYGVARNKLLKGQLPGRAGIRTEEFVNYFRPDLVAPTNDALALSVEMAPSFSRDGKDRWLLRVGVRAQEIQAWERDPLALVLVVDVSGSMKNHDRMGLVKRAVERMLDNLDSRDTVAIVTFNGEATEILSPTSVGERDAILAATEAFSPGGGTDAALGLQLGYKVAAAGAAPGVISRVVLLSDGLANTGQTDQVKILESVREHLNRGVHLNTLGVGIEGHNDTFLEQLADGGDGICDFVDDDRAIQRALGERFAGAFIPVADDVKIQVEFNGRQVVRWRQLGYENRAIADAAFRDDAVDAGEVGAGHQVTALFEIELDRGLVYDGTSLATARLRWKDPKVGGQDNSLRQATERSLDIMANDALAHPGSTSPGYQRAAVTAQFAEFLRRSVHARGDSVPALLAAAEELLRDPEFAQDEDTLELVDLIRRATGLGLEEAQLSNAVQAATDDLREIEHVCRQLDSLPGRMNTGDRNRLGAARRQAQERLRQAIAEDEAQAREATGWSHNGILVVQEAETVRKR